MQSEPAGARPGHPISGHMHRSKKAPLFDHLVGQSDRQEKSAALRNFSTPYFRFGSVWMARLGKNFLTFLQHWSGAVMCPASLYAGEKLMLCWVPSRELFVPYRRERIASSLVRPRPHIVLRRCRRGQERCEHDSPGKFRHG